MENRRLISSPQRRASIVHPLMISFCFALVGSIYAQGLWVADLWVGDFEDGRKPNQLGSTWKQAYCCDHSFSLVTSPVRGGRYAARMYLRDSDPLTNNGARAEITRAIGVNLYGKYTVFDLKGSERWYGYSEYLPSNWINDTQGPDITMQFHTKYYPQARAPAMDIEIEGNELDITDRWDGGSVHLWNGPIVRGEWVDWVFHVKWSTNPDGFVEVWRNGVKIVNRFNYPTCYDSMDNDEGTGPGGTFFKTGVYHWAWKFKKTDATERTIYKDEVRVANENGSYDLVSPSTFRAVATANDTAGYASHDVDFLGYASNGTPPFEYHWSFGDGDTAIGRSVRHTYTTPHSYVARLKIKDNTGETTAESTYSACKVINVFDSTSFLRCPSMLYFTPGMPFRYRVPYEAPGAISKTWKIYKAPSWIDTTMLGQYITGDSIPREVRLDTVIVGLNVDGVEEIKTIYFFIGKEIENMPLPAVGVREAQPAMLQQMRMNVLIVEGKDPELIITSPVRDNVSISVFDIFGRSVWKSKRNVKPGANSAKWNIEGTGRAKAVPGIYLILLKGSRESIAQKVLLKMQN